jgi:hypothetical protein
MRSALFAVLAIAAGSCVRDSTVSLDPRLSREALLESGAPYTISHLPTLNGSRNRPFVATPIAPQ